MSRREAAISHAGARKLGWRRVDDQPWGKLNAKWRNTQGWRLEHCGHQTALYPWMLFHPDGEMILTGVRHEGRDPKNGTAWPDLRSAMTYVATGR